MELVPVDVDLKAVERIVGSSQHVRDCFLP